MKTSTLVLVLTLLVSSLSAQQLNFEIKEHDFGDIAQGGGSVRFDFPFTNVGTSPLVITYAVTSCTCTKVQYSKRPIMPGQKGVVTVVYNPKTQSGVLHKAIQIYSNDARGRQIITTKGRVITN